MKLQDVLSEMGKSSCLAQCYIFFVEKYVNKAEINEVLIGTDLLKAYYNKSGIDSECFVNDAVELLNSVNDKKRYSVEKRAIKSLNDLQYTPYAAVRFDNNGYSHWVFCYYGEIIYDSLEKSVCVRLGSPVTARIIKVAD